jgi:hypothetical protein
MFSGCATSLPVTEDDRRRLPAIAELIPAAPPKARQSEEFRKQRWNDGVVELAYTYRGRHDGLPILIHSAIGEYPTIDDAIMGRSDLDNDHRRIFVSLEQRESETFIPAGPEAKTHLLFAGMQPVGLRFSTRVGAETFSMLFLAPPQFFDAHRVAERVMKKVGSLGQREMLKP